MSQADQDSFKHSYRQDNNPEAADHARRRIHEMHDAYAAAVTPSKHELAKRGVNPVSPAAESQSSFADAPSIKDVLPPRKREHEEPRVPKHRAQVNQSDIAPEHARAVAAEPVAKPVAATKPEPVVEPAPKATPPPVSPLATPKAEAEVKHAPKPKRELPPMPSLKRPILVGIACFIIPVLIFKLQPLVAGQLAYLTNKTPTTSQQVAGGSGEAISQDPVLTIPKINVSAPIVFAKSNKEEAIQKDLEGGVVHYANTAMPGQNGNSAIFGHSSNDWWEPGSFKFVFILLDRLVVGDTFSVNYQGHKYIYQVYATQVVTPNQVEVLNATLDAQMTLITCTPPGTSWKRLVIKAKLVGAPASSVATTPATDREAAEPAALSGNGNSFTKLWDGFVGIFHRRPGAPIEAGTTTAS